MGVQARHRLAGSRALWPVAILALLLVVPRLPLRVPLLFDGLLNAPGHLQPLAVAFALGIAALSCNPLFGYTGVLSFGHALFFGAGVYLPTIARRKWDWSLGPALALAIGALALRTKGAYFATVTLAFARVGAVLVGENPGELTGGEGAELQARDLSAHRGFGTGGTGRWRCWKRTAWSRTSAASAPSTTCRCASRRGRSTRWSGRTARARRPSSTC